jgi:hypothetical protein
MAKARASRLNRLEVAEILPNHHLKVVASTPATASIASNPLLLVTRL